MKISVIVPCYNAEQYIPHCLVALSNQTFRDFEVICINDSSTDGTERVIQEFATESSIPIKCITNEVNLGPAMSRNIAIENSHGEYICFCDSDDWYDDDFLNRMVSEAESNDSDIVFCGHKLIVEASGRIIEHPLELDIDVRMDKRKLLVSSVDSLWAMMVRRTIISQVNIPDIRVAEDMAVIPVLISHAERFGVVKDCIYNYLARPGSASMIFKEDADGSIPGLISFSFIRCSLPEKYGTEVEFLGARNLIYGALLTIFTHSYNIGRAERILWEFEKVCPNWINNPYLKTLSYAKRVFLICAHNRCFRALRLLSRIHYKIVTL